jgi:hypothetical protein
MFTGIWQDLRYGSRSLLKNPGFSAVVVLTLALAIGANTSLFSVVNGVLLNPLPYPDPDQLVTLHQSKPNFETGAIPYPNFRDLQKENRTFSAMAISRGFGFSLIGTGEAERVNGRLISADFFSVLGVTAARGRTFRPGDDAIGADPLVLISAELWQRKFGAAEDVVGKGLTLDDKNYTIVGVIPASFSLLRNTDVYVPTIRLFPRPIGVPIPLPKNAESSALESHRAQKKQSAERIRVVIGGAKSIDALLPKK